MFKTYYFERLSSTTDKAKEFGINSVIIAREQSEGKGRFERSWSSGKGGIYLSIVLGKDNANYLTFIAAISVCRAVRDVCRIKTRIKWPNDIIFGKKKLCGILTEVSKKAVVGIGVNTNNKIPRSLEKKAVSLDEIRGKEVDNKRIIKSLLKHFEHYLEELKARNYSKIIEDWKKDSFLGSEIKVKTIDKEYSGTAHDVDSDCFLILKDKKGKKIRIVEGDVLLETVPEAGL
ncbi:biotin--[acetyl-CoA-carboxylase] ligase [Candidatus Woesearchaeota archaeon]|nr:biotin--[acetyl-CoA-carboxylase] ligase [Candidatus Woesearchaeota archaeon]